MTKNITVSLPESILSGIDSKRGDVNRSRYLLRIIEESYHVKQINKNRSQTAHGVGRSSKQSMIVDEPIITQEIDSL